MNMRQYVLFSLCATLSLFHIAFDLVLPTTSSQTNANILSSSLTCLPQVALQTKLSPHLHNCAQAVRGFATTSKINTFKRPGPQDPRMLDRIGVARYRDCFVRADIRKHDIATAKGTWLEISLAATQLAMACIGRRSQNVAIAGHPQAPARRGRR